MILCTVWPCKEDWEEKCIEFLCMFVSWLLKTWNPLFTHSLALNFKLLYLRWFLFCLRVESEGPLYSLSPWFLLASLLVIFTLVWPLPPRFSLLWALLPSRLCGWTKDSTLSPPGTSFSTCPPRALKAQIIHCHCVNDLHVLVSRPTSLMVVGHVGWTFSTKNQDGFNLERTDWALCAEVSEAGYLKLHGGCVCSEMAPGIFSEVVRRTAPLPDPTACPSHHHTPLHVPDWGCSPL